MRKPVIIKEDLYQMLSERAERENRNVTNMVDTLLREAIGWHAGSFPQTVTQLRETPRGKLVSIEAGTKEAKKIPNYNPPVSLSKGLFEKNYGTCKLCGVPLREDKKCQTKGCKFAGKVQ